MIIRCPSCSKPNRLPAARVGDRARCPACKAALLPLDRPIAVVSASDFDELAARFAIQSIPTMILFRGGKEATRLSGAMPAGAIMRQLGV